jgi:hypothetical protein
MVFVSESKSKQLTNWAIYLRLNNLDHAYWFPHITEDEKSVTEVKYKVLVRHLRQETEETNLYLIDRILDVYINDELPNYAWMNWLDFTETDSSKFSNNNCIYELYNRDGKRKITINYHEKVKWVDIKIL